MRADLHFILFRCMDQSANLPDTVWVHFQRLIEDRLNARAALRMKLSHVIGER